MILHRDYSYALVWLLLLNFISASNDALGFFLGQDISPIQVAFCRFLVTMLSVLPFMIPQGLRYFRTDRLGQHALRAGLGALALGASTYAVAKVPLMKNTCISFLEPMMVLPLAALFLGERVDRARWGCTLLGLVGLLFVTYQDFESFNGWIALPLLATFLFAVSTLISRAMVFKKEHITTLLFYFGLGTSLLFLIPALQVWKPLTGSQIALLTLLGINGNLIQVCMFKAFKVADVSAFMPLRYGKLIFTFLFGALLFHQIPTSMTWLGGLIIIISALLIAFLEKQKEQSFPR